MVRAWRSCGLFLDLLITCCENLSLHLCLSGLLVCLLRICLVRLIRCFERGTEMQRSDFPKIAEPLGSAVKQRWPAQPGVMFDITPQT